MGGVVKNQHSKTHTHRNINVWPFSKGPFTTCCVHCVTHVSCKWIQLSIAYCMSGLSTRAQRRQEQTLPFSHSQRKAHTMCPPQGGWAEAPGSSSAPSPAASTLIPESAPQWQEPAWDDRRPAFYLPSFKGLLKPSFSRRKAATGPSPFPGGSSRSGSNTWEGPWANWRSQRLQGRALHLYLVFL